jgi:hypothetical protein
MRKSEEDGTAVPQQTSETLTPEDISAMLAEAAAVDALFERARRERLHFVSTVCAYLSSPEKDAKADPAA